MVPSPGAGIAFNSHLLLTTRCNSSAAPLPQLSGEKKPKELTPLRFCPLRFSTGVSPIRENIPVPSFPPRLICRGAREPSFGSSKDPERLCWLWGCSATSTRSRILSLNRLFPTAPSPDEHTPRRCGLVPWHTCPEVASWQNLGFPCINSNPRALGTQPGRLSLAQTLKRKRGVDACVLGAGLRGEEAAAGFVSALIPPGNCSVSSWRCLCHLLSKGNPAHAINGALPASGWAPLLFLHRFSIPLSHSVDSVLLVFNQN